MKYIYSLLSVFILISCSKKTYTTTSATVNYYEYVTIDSTYLYPIEDFNSDKILVIPPSTKIIIASSIDNFTPANYNSFSGYTIKVNTQKLKKVPSYNFIPAITSDQYYSLQKSNSQYNIYKNSQDSITKSKQANVSSGNSLYNSPPSTNSAVKTVHVNGYYRSNGTYVHSYDRRPPSHH